MPDNDYIKLKNGEKFYFNNCHGKVKVKDFSNLAHNWGVFFDEKYSGNLTPDEIGVIFDKVKEYAMRDGKKSFSKTEMEAFINDIWVERCDEPDITSDDVGLSVRSLVQFLTELQEKLNNSGENVDEKVNDDIYNQILESFPEIENPEFKERQSSPFTYKSREKSSSPILPFCDETRTFSSNSYLTLPSIKLFI